MHLIAVILAVYVIFAEWRSVEQKRKLNELRRLIVKLQNEQSAWYAGVLPEVSEVCLFEEKDGNYILATLADKRWQKKDGSVDYDKIKRWAYLKDIEKL